MYAGVRRLTACLTVTNHSFHLGPAVKERNSALQAEIDRLKDENFALSQQVKAEEEVAAQVRSEAGKAFVQIEFDTERWVFGCCLDFAATAVCVFCPFCQSVCPAVSPESSTTNPAVMPAVWMNLACPHHPLCRLDVSAVRREASCLMPLSTDIFTLVSL